MKRFLAFGAVLALVLGSVAMIGALGARAHEGTPHPAHIHSGTCETLGDVVYPLNDVGMGEMSGEAVGAAAAIPVDVSVTTVEAALADIVAGEHAINVHQDSENMGNYITCGDIGGAMMGESDLVIGLGELNDSGYSGVALLHDNGDGTTEVRVFATTKGDGGHEHDMGTPDASAGDASAEGETVEVAIENFSYGDPLEITVGTTVTWTNMDSAPHTATSSGNFQSNGLNQGESFSFTFEEAGTFDYFCEFHPNMSSTITVTE